MKTPKKQLGTLQMVSCSTLWSFGSVLVKLLPWNAFAISGLRSFIAAGVIGAYLGKNRMRPILNRKVILSAVFMALTFTAYILANKLTTAANANVLQFTSPVFVLIIGAVFLHKRIRPADIVAVLLTLGGISLFFLDKLAGGNMLGNVVAICAGLFMALMYTFTGAANEQERMSGVLFGQLLTALIGLPFIIMYGLEITIINILVILALGIFQLGISYVLYALALRNISPFTCSLINAIEPLMASLLAMIFLGEIPGQYALYGVILVVSTVTVWYAWCALRPYRREAGSKEA